MDFLNTKCDREIELKSFDINLFPKEETLMCIGNGYIVSRGTNDEMRNAFSRETYLNGFFNQADKYEVEELVNIPDVFEFEILIDNQKIGINTMTVLNYSKILDLKYGILTREYTIYHNDAEVNIKIEKYANMVSKNVIHQNISISTNKPIKLTIIDKIDGTYSNNGKEHLYYDEKKVVDSDLCYKAWTRNDQQIEIRSNIKTNLDAVSNITIKRKKILRSMTFDLTSEVLNITKTIIINESEQGNKVSTKVEHMDAWDQLWAQSRIRIDCDNKIQTALDFSNYHLIINRNSLDEHSNLAAKGLTGHGYKGHVFWDTEIFLLPYYTAVFPDDAKALLKYRYNSLSAARAKAKKYNFTGAMLPWEGTRDQSVDATPEYGPINVRTGKAEKIINAEKEIHITADVAYGVDYYFNHTGDIEFMQKWGNELIIETAKFWLSRLEYNEQLDIYEITDVVGPDEYKEHVNNNAFTNQLAKFNIELVNKYYNQAIISNQQLAEFDFDVKQSVEIANKIKIQMPNEDNLIAQDDTYLTLKTIDLTDFKQPGNVGLINKVYSMDEKCQIQVGKQADTLLLFKMFKNDYHHQVKLDNYLYYEDKCLHDSSLSMVTHSIIASDLKLTENAFGFFKDSMKIDYLGSVSSSDEGIHFASMGGHWLNIVRGFAGIYVDDKLYVNPQLPSAVNEIEFNYYYKQVNLKMLINKEWVNITNQSNADIEITVLDQDIKIKGGEVYECFTK